MAHRSLRAFARTLIQFGLIVYAAHLSASVLLWAGHTESSRTSTITLPLAASFEENHDTDARIRYTWRGSTVMASFGSGGTVSIRSVDGASVDIKFTGGAVQAEPKGEDASGQKTFYYLGHSQAWRANEHYRSLRYAEIYPGIDLVFVTNQGRIEYNFEIAPGADPSNIRIHYSGLTPRISPEGNLEVVQGGLRIVQRRPQAFQLRQGRSVTVPCSYRLRGREALIDVAKYNRSAPLLIDPVLDFSTYLGGSGFDAIYAATADSSGNLFVTGETSSGSLTNPSLPVRGSRDAFVAKLNSTATQVLFLVYLGGSGNDSGRGIALDSAGGVYVTGITASNNFPVTSGALSATAPGAQDAFVTKLSSGGQLQYSTYLGGGTSDYGFAIAVDATGAAYVAGQTSSPSFPVTGGSFQTTYNGGLSDCFVSKLNATGTALIYSTFLGGSALDLCSGIALDSAGNAYVTGSTYSSNFPTASAVQSSLLGTANAFVAKLNSSGSNLVYSTYIGGSNTDNGNAIALDSSNNVYIAGTTSSVDFPVTAGTFQTALAGTYNAFCVKLAASGASLIYGTLVGGSNSDTAAAIAVDSAGHAILGGYTNSSNFPAGTPIQSSLGGSFDAFATVLDPAGATLIFSSYAGGSGDDRAYAVVPAAGSKLYLLGTTASSNFPTVGAEQPTLSADYDAFLLQLSYAISNPIAVSVTPGSGTGSAQTFAAGFSDAAGSADILVGRVLINSSLTGTSACFLYYTAAGTTLYLLTDAGALQSGLTVGTAGTLSNSQCSVNVGASSVVVSANTLTLNLAVTFAAAFAGSKSVFLECQSATVVGGWAQLGTWTVIPPMPPTAVSVTPSSGSGLKQTFAAVFSDPAGAGDIAAARVLINSSLTGTSACFLYYTAAGTTLYLLTDAGALLSGVTIGTAGTLSNSQCSVNVATSSVLASGNTLALNLALTFLPAFAGAKDVFLEAQNATVLGAWAQSGVWTVP